MDTLLQDLRVGWRALRRSPSFTVVASLTIALGIAVNTVVFSLTYGLLLRPLPFPDPERVVTIVQTRPDRPREGRNLSPPNFRDLAERLRSCEQIGASRSLTGNVNFGREPVRLSMAAVTPGFFATLGARPILGRAFQPEESQPGRNLAAVIISHSLWSEQFGADPGIIGRALRVDGRVRTIVGVMPRDFHWPQRQDLWVPFGFDSSAGRRDDFILWTVARLRRGVSVRQAGAEVTATMAAIAREHPQPDGDVGARLMTFRDLAFRDGGAVIILLELAVVLVLLIACVNVANLMLARAAGRRQESALRLALGASRGRLLRQQLTESLVLAGLGGLAGALLAYWGHRAALSLIPAETLNPVFDFSIDAPVLLFAACATALSVLLFGLVPALEATDTRLGQTLREGGVQGGTSRRHHRMRSTLVVVEVALSIVLLVATGLLLRSLANATALPSAVRTEGVLTASLNLPGANYPGDADRVRFYREFLPRIATLPGVTEVAAVSHLPFSAGGWTEDVVAEVGAGPGARDQTRAKCAICTPGYFRTIRLPLRRGRDFTAADDSASTPVAIVTESLARRLWPGRDPLGRRVHLGTSEQAPEWRTVVGVVGDVVQDVSGDRNPAALFEPHAQDPTQRMSLVVHATGAPGPLAARLRELARAVDPDLPLFEMGTLPDHVRSAVWLQRFCVSLLSVYAALALLLAAVGLYGVMSYSVAQRRREIGIRTALGAARAVVVRMVVGQALRLTLLGSACGLAGAFGLARLMRALFPDVSPADPLTYVVVTVLVGASALLAAWVPAFRAARVDPMTALRCE